jgi:hypothetical protein
VCARIFYLILAALFVFLVGTVAAFYYLEWWQAILASGVMFLLIVFSAKLLIQTAIGRFGEKFKEMMDAQSRVLRGATVDVHAVRPTAPPRELLEAADDPDADEYDRAEAAADLQNLRWYEIELTVFPDPAAAGPVKYWDLYQLQLVPGNAPPPGPMGAYGDDEDDPREVTVHGVQKVEDGEAVDVEDGNVTGPQRLRLTAGVPRGVKGLKFQYQFEQFGEVRLPSGPAIR